MVYRELPWWAPDNCVSVGSSFSRLLPPPSSLLLPPSSPLDYLSIFALSSLYYRSIISLLPLYSPSIISLLSLSLPPPKLLRYSPAPKAVRRYRKLAPSYFCPHSRFQAHIVDSDPTLFSKVARPPPDTPPTPPPSSLPHSQIRACIPHMTGRTQGNSLKQEM